MRPETRLVWTETPTNPLMRSSTSRPWRHRERGGARLMVTGPSRRPACSARSSSARTRSCTRPRSISAATATCRGARWFRRKRDDLASSDICTRATSSAPSPRRSTRGSSARPADSRVPRRAHSSNALAVARAPADHPGVEAVHYPGLVRTRPRDRAAPDEGVRRDAFVRIRGGRERAIEVAARVKLFINATSLGGT